MDQVYGPYKFGSQWIPKPYADNKSRYLWTDAFGVCNYITLFNETGQSHFLAQADALIKNVHDVLGKDRRGQRRLNSASDEHPLRGGLRIGKVDPEGEPDGDGQYFHYLTKWMFALNRMALARKDVRYNNWAVELAQAIHPHFVQRPDSARPRMHWKMSIDLSRPLVPSEGNLDPFDGYVTYRLLQQSSEDKTVLSNEVATLEKIVQSKYESYSSDDALDLGEALWITHWFLGERWSSTVSSRSFCALERLWNDGYFQMNSALRLAFREFGTTIGVQVNGNLKWRDRVEQQHEFWSKRIFSRDRDITPVMYCSSLNPGVFSAYYCSPCINAQSSPNTE